jgi:hypothetical protein
MRHYGEFGVLRFSIATHDHIDGVTCEDLARDEVKNAKAIDEFRSRTLIEKFTAKKHCDHGGEVKVFSRRIDFGILNGDER